MLHAATATIDLHALRANLQLVKELAPASQVLAMIKADAYGHGLLPVARALLSDQGCHALAVARLSEALTLRENGISAPVVLMGAALDTRDFQRCVDARIDLLVHENSQLQRIAELPARATLRVWLKLDSGMHRLGFDDAGFLAAYALLRQVPAVKEIIALSHFSCADEPDSGATSLQMARFDRLCAELPLPQSLANSAALIRLPETHRQWVRPGLMLYGANPLPDNCSLPYARPLQPVMSLRAPVLAVREIGVGESVGYGASWVAARPSRIATLAIGYGDGYPRHARNGTPVLIKGKLAALAGRVSMDLISIDVTDCGAVAVGDEAQLWGAELPVETVARWADTIPYTLLTGISPRVARHYLGDDGSAGKR